MNTRRAYLYLVLALIFVFNLAAASIIHLVNSDEEPWEKNFPGQCAHPVVSVVYENPNVSNPKVIEVDLAGDFSNCVGSQVLVTTYKTGKVYSYGVAEVSANQTQIQISFIKHGGEFYQKFPAVVNNRLVSQGPTAPSSNSIDPAQITTVFAWTWN